jgi:predicted anti-sigma-YlaC factor YlaD
MTKHPVEPEELQAFLDKELKPARQAEVGRHLQDCQECVAMIADLQKVSATLHRWEVEPAPANLKPPGLPVERPRGNWNWSRLVVGLGASVAVVLLIAAISIPNLLRSRMSVQTARQNAGEPSPLNLPSDALRKGAGSGGSAGFRGGSGDEEVSGIVGPKSVPATTGRLIAYQVSMMIEVKDFDPAKQELLQIVEQAGGYVAQASTAETPNQPRSASLTVRVPADKLSAVLQQFRGLGRVRQDQLSTEEVTEQVVDLEARLKNARATEQRLIDVLNNRTGKVGDILQVEQEISRTRENIERMEAQRQNLMRRVEMATVNVTLAEEFKAQLETTPIGTGTRLWNALVDGYESFMGTLLGIVFFFARYGLILIFWSGVCWMGWRLARPRVKRLLAQAGITA